MKLIRNAFMFSGLSIMALGSCDSNSIQENEFRYLADEFADIKIIRYRVDDWDSMTLQQKEYIYHLSEAAKWGRDILFDQNFKYNLKIRKALEKMVEAYDGDADDREYREFLTYVKRVFFSNGIHHHYAEEKFTPGCSEEFFKNLMAKADIGAREAEELVPLIYDMNLYRYRRYPGKDKDIVKESAVNFYEGVTKDEVERFYSRMEDPSDETPISYGLNSKLVKENGTVKELTYRKDGLYGAAIEKIIGHLEAASAVAENDVQKGHLAKLIEYYRTGDLRTWDEYNILWVKDTVSTVDYVNGFIENYTDPMGMKATWESIVNIKDIKASERTALISENAQWFEDNSPVDARFKKETVKGISAKVINAVCLGGDCYPTAPIGINLPNADWIRKDYGSKSVTIANLTEAYDKAVQESPKNLTNEFAYDSNEIEMSKKYGFLTNNLHTDLHECLGHGSGKLLPGTSPNALQDVSSSLEEARADLFALYYLADSKLIELGIMPDAEAYKAEYANYIRNGIFTQFVRIEYGKDVTQAHMQARKLIAQWTYEKGLDRKIIEKKTKDGKTYFVINDHEALRGLFGDLLAEIQRIKSEGDYKAGKALIENYATKIDPALHREVLDRYASLQLKPYGGFMNPEITPVTKDGKTVDYKLTYCRSFLEQMMKYGKEYSAL